MPTSTEIFINSELPKRPYTNQFPLTLGHVPVATGVGLQVEARALTTSDISGMSNYATQGDLSNVLAGLWDDRGAYTVNAAGNINYPSSAGSGVAGALMKGDIFTVAGAVAGVSTINNIAVNNGDTVRALVDNPSATDNAHWAIAENNIGYVPENRANKTTNTDLSGATGTYPDTPTVKSYIDKYDISAASINSTGTVTLTRTASDLTFQVPTAISGLSFDANTGVLTSSYTNNATSTTITVAANEVSDNVFRIKDNDDATKKIAFEASGITAGQTRTITVPDSNVNLGNVAQAASTSTAGYLTSADWTTFNTKEQGGYITVSSNFTAEVGKKYRTVWGLNSAITITPPATTVNGAYFTVFYSYMTSAGSVTCTNPNISAGPKDAWQEYEYTYDTTSGGWLPLRKSLGPIVPTGSSFQLVNPTTPDAKFIIQAPTSTGLYTLTMPNANVNLGKVAQAASTSSDGYLTSTDWNTFNGKGNIAAYTAGNNYAVNDIVTFASSLWRVTTAHTGVATPDGRIEHIGDKLFLNVSSSFTCYKLGEGTSPVSKELELWVSGSSATIDLNNAPTKVIIRTTNAYDITTLTLNRASTTFYSNKSSVSIGSNSVQFKVTGGSALELIVYSAEVLVYEIQQHMTGNFKLVNGNSAEGVSNVGGWTFTGPPSSSNYSFHLPAKNADLGNLSFVATTNSNNLSGTNCHILGGGSNTVSGTGVVAVGCNGCDLSMYTNNVIAIGLKGTTNSYAVAPSQAILLGSSALTTSIFNISGAHAAALGVIQCVYSDICQANGTTYNATLNGVNTPSSTNCIKLLPSASVLSSAVIDLDFIIVIGDNMAGALLAPRRTVFAKRRVYVVFAFNDSDVGAFNSSVEVIGTDTSVGSAATGTVTVGVTVDSANNRLIPTVSATSGSKQILFQFGVRSTAHYNRNV